MSCMLWRRTEGDAGFDAWVAVDAGAAEMAIGSGATERVTGLGMALAVDGTLAGLGETTTRLLGRRRTAGNVGVGVSAVGVGKVGVGAIATDVETGCATTGWGEACSDNEGPINQEAEIVNKPRSLALPSLGASALGLAFGIDADAVVVAAGGSNDGFLMLATSGLSAPIQARLRSGWPSL